MSPLEVLVSWTSGPFLKRLPQAPFCFLPFLFPPSPCSNQFLFQEPGTNAQIKKFAESKGFTGALMDKIHVNDPDMHPVYKWLKVTASLVRLLVQGSDASQFPKQA